MIIDYDELYSRVKQLLKSRYSRCGLRAITPDKPEVPWITQITLDYSGLSRITPVYQFGSPSGPAYHQSCFSLRITEDYCGLRRITPDYLGLPVLITKWPGGLPELFPPRDYRELPRITQITLITPIYSDHRGLLSITSDYTGLPVLITKWPGGLPELFPPRDYRELSRITQITLITPIYSDHRGLLWITSDYTGLPVWITKWISGLSELFPPRDYHGLRRTTSDCPGLNLFTLITPTYSNLLRITLIYFGLPRITS